jgi:hypothetical protein
MMAGRGGWYGEPKRHSLAAKGILTTRKPSDIAKPVYPSLPKARYATALVRDFDSGEGKQGYAQIPDFLYHGTSAKNIDQIFKEGIKSNLDPTDWTVEDKHADDSYNNVSMARDLKDAVMFSIGSTGWTGDQAIFKIDTSKLEVFHRDRHSARSDKERPSKTVHKGSRERTSSHRRRNL